MYRKCNTCSFISKFNKNEELKCKQCGSADELTIYPVQAAVDFLERVDTNIYDLDDPDVLIDLYNFEGFETTSLFLCTAYEVLLETLISDELNSIKIPNYVSELLSNSNQGQEKMGRLFAKLVGEKSIKAVFRLISSEDFHDKIKEIIGARNSYIHGNPRAFKDSDLEAEDLKIIADSMMDIFVILNNSFVNKEHKLSS
ncbi:hypothetical protein [Peribacillus simplex]|uniref:hypothetical protein n=1 Tax=Peribacillus simplex TaxID=1478 RepID=UPI0033399E76